MFSASIRSARANTSTPPRNSRCSSPKADKSQEVTETEREILINALGLNELWVRDVMTPRNKVIILDADEPFEKTLEIALRSKHTRFPLVKGHLDHAIGLIHIKDLFKLINDPRSGPDAHQARTQDRAGHDAARYAAQVLPARARPPRHGRR